MYPLPDGARQQETSKNVTNDSARQLKSKGERPELFPGPGGKWQVSTTSGSSPTWSPAKRELLYQGGDGQILVVS
jgi:hypothetical protein